MGSWGDIYEKVTGILRRAGRDPRFFRGHADVNWKLIPGVGRLPHNRRKYLENVFIFDFVTRAGALLQDRVPSWRSVFAMQHHGLPTRLLDWTESFGVALFFALREGRGDTAVWVLNPFDLNERTRPLRAIADVNEFADTYYDYFIAEKADFVPPIVALSPPADHPRILHQRGCFTLHKNVDEPLDELYPETVEKIVIPSSARTEAQLFLRSAGISEFSLFPDLDGLARELRQNFM